MRVRFDRRLARHAAYMPVHLAIVLGAIVAGGSAGGLAVLVASIPLLFAWGAFQADVQLNPRVDDTRDMWRVLLYLLPWSMAVYWWLNVRPRRADA